MRNLDCRRIQCDEIWSYVGKKQMHLQRGDDRQRLGDQWTFVAIDADTKLVPIYRVGKRTREHAIAFMTDLSERLRDAIEGLHPALLEEHWGCTATSHFAN
jgi:hypothetical protein